MTWKHEDSIKPEDHVGFVYIITNNINHRYYIGQKKFWFKHRLKPLKGKKNHRLRMVESDWKSYWGSCKELLMDIEKHGAQNFTRTILYLCKSKAKMNYIEAREQFEFNVLYDSKSYNRIINCRISSGQLGL